MSRCSSFKGGFNPDLKNPIVEGIRRYSITENRWLETKRPTGTPSKTLASHAAVAHGHFILVTDFITMPSIIIYTVCRVS